jgi:hypothetical protein
MIVGCAAAAAASLLDAVMYVMVERALKMGRSPGGEGHDHNDYIPLNDGHEVEGYDGELLSRDDDSPPQSVSPSVGRGIVRQPSEYGRLSSDMGHANVGLPTPLELTLAMGAINLVVGGAWAAGLLATGRWADIVRAPYEDHPSWPGQSSVPLLRDHRSSVVLLWASIAVSLFLHYLAFWYCVLHANSLVAGINKAVQSATLFAISSVLYCSNISHQCATPADTAGAFIVCVAVVIYGFKCGRKRRPTALLQRAMDGFESRRAEEP